MINLVQLFARHWKLRRSQVRALAMAGCGGLILAFAFQNCGQLGLTFKNSSRPYQKQQCETLGISCAVADPFYDFKPLLTMYAPAENNLITNQKSLAFHISLTQVRENEGAGGIGHLAHVECELMSDTGYHRKNLPCELGLINAFNDETLVDGVYSLRIRASLDTFKSEWVTKTFFLNTKAPLAQIAGPGKKSDLFPYEIAHPKNPFFTLGFEPGLHTESVTFECSLNSSSFAPCPVNLDIEKFNRGPLVSATLHQLAVRAKDQLGNLQSLPTTYSWVYDSTDPVFKWTSTSRFVPMGEAVELQFTIQEDHSPLHQVTCFANDKPILCPISQTSASPLQTTGTILAHIDNATTNFQVFVESQIGRKVSSKLLTLYADASLKGVANFELGEEKPLDILMVLDSSASMNEHLTKVHEAASGLLSKLKGLDWRLAFTHTSVQQDEYLTCSNMPDLMGYRWGSAYVLSRACSDFIAGAPAGFYMLAGSLSKVNEESKIVGSDGLLWNLDGKPESFWIEDSTPNGQKLFMDTIDFKLHNGKTFNGGDQHERAILTIKRALERSRTTGAINDKNKQFFRPNAHLATLIISDEDEAIYSEYGTDILDFSQTSGGKAITPTTFAEIKKLIETKYKASVKILAGQKLSVNRQDSRHVTNCPKSARKLANGNCEIAHGTSATLKSLKSKYYPKNNFSFSSIVKFREYSESGLAQLTPEQKTKKGVGAKLSTEQEWATHCAQNSSQKINSGCLYRAAALANSGFVADIEQKSYSADFETFGALVKGLNQELTIVACTKGIAGIETISLNGVAYTGTYTIAGQKLRFSQDLSPGNWRVSYICNP